MICSLCGKKIRWWQRAGCRKDTPEVVFVHQRCLTRRSDSASDSGLALLELEAALAVYGEPRPARAPTIWPGMDYCYQHRPPAGTKKGGPEGPPTTPKAA